MNLNSSTKILVGLVFILLSFTLVRNGANAQSLTGVQIASGITADRYPVSVGVRTLMQNNEKNITFKIKNTSGAVISRAFKLYILPLPSGTPVVLWSGISTFTVNQTLTFDRNSNVELGNIVTQNVGSYRLELRGSNTANLTTVTPTSPLVSAVSGVNPLSIKVIADTPTLTLVTETAGTAAVRYPTSIGTLKLQTQKLKNISYSITNLSSGAISRAFKLYIIPQPAGSPTVVWQGVVNFAANQTINFSRTNYLTELGSTVLEGPGFYKLELRGVDVPDIANVTPTSPLVPVTSNAANPVLVEIVECPDDYLAISPAGPISVCDNGTIDLSVIFSPNFTYQWRLNGIDIPGANSNTYTVTTSGSYDLVTTKTGCPSFTSPAVSVTIYAPIVATISGLNPQYSNQDAAVTLTGTPNGGTFTGPGISGNQFNPNTAGPGIHTIIYSGNYLGCDYATSQQVIVIDCPASISITPNGVINTCDNNPQTFTAVYDPTYTYQWQKDNVNIPLANLSTYTATVSGVYKVVVSKSGCSTVTSDLATLTITPVITPSISGLLAQYSNQAPAVTMTGSPSGGTFSGPGVTGNQFNPNTAGPGTHIITYSGDINGCPYSTTRSVTVIDCPASVSITPNGTINTCNNASQIFTTPLDPTVTYQWQRNNVNIPLANSNSYTATTSGQYKLIVSKTGCTTVISNVATLTITPVINPSISGLLPQYSNQAPIVTMTGSPIGGIFTGPGVTGIQFNPNTAGPGTHIITYSGNVNGCPYSTTRSVTVIDCPATISVTPAGPLTLCDNATQVLTATTGVGFTYQWQRNNVNIPGQINNTITVGGNLSGGYKVIVNKTGCGTVISNIVNITFNPPIVATISGLNNTYSQGDPAVTMTGNPAGGTFSGPGVTGNQFNPTIAGPGTHTITYAGTFNGCPYTATFRVTVTACPNSININPNGNISICFGQTVTLTAPIDPTFSYQWQKENTNIINANSNSLVVSQNGTYKVVVNKVGCPQLISNTATVTILDPIVVRIVADTILDVTDPPITMTATPPGGTFTGPGVVINQFFPALAGVGLHRVLYQGTFNGCPYVDSIFIRVNPVLCQDLTYWKDNLVTQTQFFTLIDFDNDLVTDLVTLKSNPGQLNFYRNNGAGFDPPIIMPVLAFPKIKLPHIGHSENTDLFFNDYDNDGVKDLLVTFSNTTNCTSDAVRIYWGTAAPPYFNAGVFTGLGVGGSCVDAYSIDYEGDGDQDIFIEAAIGGERMYRNNGARNFVSVPTMNTGRGIDFSVFDWNVDGKEDLLGVDYGNIDLVWGIQYYSSLGNGNFNAPQTHYGGNNGEWPRKPHLHLQADPNNNFELDFVFNALNDGTNGIRLYTGTWNNIGNTFNFRTQNVLADRAQLTNILDWDFDGNDDVLYYVQNHNFSGQNVLFAQLNDGNGSFNRRRTIISSSNPSMRFFGAFDMQGDCYKILGQSNDSIYIYNADPVNPRFVREDAAAQIDLDANVFSIYPNPTQGDLNLEFGSFEETKAIIQIVDPLGRVVSTEEMFAKEGVNMVSLDLSSLSAGVYILYVNCGSVKRTTKIAVND